MELELKKSCLDAYETGGDLTLTQEETAETIVPDYCPDMARIIATEGTVCILNRELREGKGTVSGTVRITVLYVPEGEGGIRAVNLSLPFTVESDHRALSGCHVLTAETETEFLESRILNPRKIFTHCKLITRLTGYQRTPFCFCSDVEAEDSLQLQKKKELQHTVLLTDMAEKDFTFAEEVNLSPGRSGAAEILSSKICSTVTETKSVGKKLIFKGTFRISLMYRSVEGACCAAAWELPFSQIMETEHGTENSMPSLCLQLTGSDIQINGDDPEGRQFSVTLYLRATALLRQNTELTLLNDLYSTLYEAHYDASPVPLTNFFETLTRRQTVREVLEIGSAANSILSLSATCGSVSIHREGEGVVLRTATAVRALYLDESGAPLAAERTMDVICQTELPENCHVTVRAVCSEEIHSSLGDRGIEVRFPVDFIMEAESRIKRPCISAAQLDLETPTDSGTTPSLVLRCLGTGESAWDLAKQYRTTISCILSANKLESEEDLPREKLLLVPGKRR